MYNTLFYITLESVIYERNILIFFVACIIAFMIWDKTLQALIKSYCLVWREFKDLWIETRTPLGKKLAQNLKPLWNPNPTLFVSFFYLFPGQGSCYINGEYQGTYQAQVNSNSSKVVQYSTVEILADSIPIWGLCHRKPDRRSFLFVDK